jgi:endonuclease YncB( thermonuclease family)
MRIPRVATAVVGVVLVSCARATPAPVPSVGVEATRPPSIDDTHTPGEIAGRELPAAPRSAVRAHVVWVTDGDTVVLSGIGVGEVHRATGGRKTRLIGVDTPEVFGGAECYGAQASAFTKRELDGTDVLVDFDVGRTDRYGRALVYIWDDRGRFFNGRLVQEGYALQLTVPPNVRYALLFTALVREAREANRGLWKGCS